jgi:subtilase family serine protease
VVAWGNNDYHQTNVPSGLTNVVAIAAGQNHSLALKGDGTVVAWGDNRYYGQINVPSGLTNVVAIAGGGYHSLALKGNGTVVAWGDNDYHQINVPLGLTNVVAIAGGRMHSLALNKLPPLIPIHHGSTIMRNVPDVALTADNVYVVCDNGESHICGGTSCAAPLWAGFTALVNQQAVAAGRPTVGFINPAIYAIGESTNYAADFHDITTGDNTSPGSPTNFYAVLGYDLCTGWGTPAGQNLINDLAGTSTSEPISPVQNTSLSIHYFPATTTNDTVQISWNGVAGLVYQVQYKTNLLQTNWINLGAATMGTNPIKIVFDVTGPDPQRFYRIRRVPVY